VGQPVMQWQLITKDPARLQAFYTKLFGWDCSADNALGYRMLDTGSERGINGGIWPAPPNAKSFVQLLIEVDDVPACVKHAAELGASVIVPPQKLPDGDEMAILHDPEGVPFGIFKPVTL
jgi:uncharacterized protein